VYLKWRLGDIHITESQLCTRCYRAESYSPGNCRCRTRRRICGHHRFPARQEGSLQNRAVGCRWLHCRARDQSGCSGQSAGR
jgi:hypothetical protein